MFSIIEFIIKRVFISFVIEDNKFHTKKIVIKNSKIIQEEENIFTEEDFLKYIKLALLENTQTYISTIIYTYNQGCLNSCSHKKYQELGIKLDNIKILCVENKFSIFIGVLELQDFKKNMQKYNVDLIYSPYLIIHQNKEIDKNSLYLLITKENLILLIYDNNQLPNYSSIYEIKSEEHKELEEDEDLDIDEIEEIDTLDDIEDIDDIENEIETIDDIEDIENIDHKENISNLKEEIETLNFIRNSIKDYYENYSNNFLEHIYILKGFDFDTKFLKDLENELFLEIKIKDVSILDTLNELARKDINV